MQTLFIENPYEAQLTVEEPRVTLIKNGVPTIVFKDGKARRRERRAK
mgnify:CR=1 FL=1